MTAHARIRRILASSGLSLTLGLLVGGPALGGQGLSVPESSLEWPRWQARLQWFDAPATRWSLLENDATLKAPRRAALLGDYDLGDFGLALPFAQGRFRATSGLLLGLQPGARTDGLALSAPYLGLGWTGWVPGSGLSFSADFGLASRLGRLQALPGPLRLGAQGAADAAQRDWPLQPRLQLGVQYRY